MVTGAPGGPDSLARIADDLRAATSASRVTVRAAVGAGATTALLAESLAPGVPSMAGAPQGGIAEAPTYVYLRTTLSPLFQDDTRQAPLPPEMLTGRFGVGAQMLGPLLVAGELIGSVSVHHQGGARVWSEAERAALVEATAAVQAVLDGAG